MKRYLLDDSTQIPRTLFPSLCWLFVAVMLGVAALLLGSKNGFRKVAGHFYEETPTPVPHQVSYTAEEQAQWDVSNARWTKVRRLEKVLIWVTISVIGLLLVTGYVLNTMAWRKLKGQPVTEGVAFLALMWFNLVCLGLVGTLFGRLAMRGKAETMLPVLGLLAAAGVAGFRFYSGMTKLGEDRVALRWPRAWNVKLTAVLLLPLLPLLLLFFRKG